ncbi:uncharacterized protein LOC115175688 [Salmo trutta]|uniref:uncharacterized protein LOC115175688 n=1 Tax=Salmo trutta TaxID=8032 RepID=UPI0011308B79|nr:uncharacterized protein LOC115175688 [Salmo trutta]
MGRNAWHGRGEDVPTVSLASTYSCSSERAAGPDGIPGRVLRVRADQLAGIFSDIFNLSLSQVVVHTCFKETTIVPVTKKKRSTEDAISIHPAESHLDKSNTYVRVLFIDYSSEFNTIVPSKLNTKLRALGLDTKLCNCILAFLTGRPQALRIGNNTSSTLTLNTEAPQGCVHSPLLYSLFIHDCVALHNTNSITKCADNTTVVGLITSQPIGRR